MGAYAIETEQLTKGFPGGITAVEDLNLRIRPGCIYGLIGPNGAGKTTALRLLMGLLRPQSGTAQILGEDLWNAPRSIRSRVAYISQTQQMHNWMTLDELCRYASRLYERWDAGYARELGGRWNLPLHQRLGGMSTGDQRKAALLLAFASRADVLVLDEPAAGLDPIARRALVNEIIDLASRGDGGAVLFSTHLLEDLERIVDCIGIMDRGRLVVSARLDALQSTVKRVQIVFQDDTVPAGFAIPGALWTEYSGPVATAVTRLAHEAQLDSIRHLPGARLHVFPLSLQEILLAFLQKAPAHSTSQSAGWTVPEEPQRWDSVSDVNL
ncbi:MAG: ABC transporter ATP-binding protein [Verrucomicrobiia bacterium]